MAQQTINIGTVANDGTGDTLRTAGGKINDNFTELYASVGSGTSRFSAVAISADTVLSAATHNNKVLEVTTGATDKLLTLPTTGNADGDEIVILKTDRAAGRVVIATLAGVIALPWLTDQDDVLIVHYSPNLGWYPLPQSNVGYRYRSGAFYGGEESAVSTASNGSSGWLMFTPIQIFKLVTFAGMGVEVTTAGSTGATLQLGLYTSKAGVPDALVAQTPYASGQVVGDATGDQYADFLGGNVSVCPGLYWRAVAASSSAVVVRGAAAGAFKSILTGQVGKAGATAAFTSDTGFVSTGGFTFGASMPSTAPSVSGRGGTNAPTAVFKVA